MSICIISWWLGNFWIFVKVTVAHWHISWQVFSAIPKFPNYPEMMLTDVPLHSCQLQTYFSPCEGIFVKPFDLHGHSSWIQSQDCSSVISHCWIVILGMPHWSSYSRFIFMATLVCFSKFPSSVFEPCDRPAPKRHRTKKQMQIAPTDQDLSLGSTSNNSLQIICPCLLYYGVRLHLLSAMHPHFTAPQNIKTTKIQCWQYRQNNNIFILPLSFILQCKSVIGLIQAAETTLAESQLI